MTTCIGLSGAWSLRDTAIARSLRSVAVATVLMCLCPLMAACGLRANTFKLPSTQVANQILHPWRVGVIVGEEFTPYRISFRYWSSPPFTWSLEGLPEAFAKTLSPYFLSVEPLQESRSLSTESHDLLAKMSVDEIHFDGANTTSRRDRVDLAMTFTVEQPNGIEVFRTSVSVSASSRYKQPCNFCKPDPRRAYTDAFGAAFAKLSEALSVSDIRLGQETGSGRNRPALVSSSPQ